MKTEPDIMIQKLLLTLLLFVSVLIARAEDVEFVFKNTKNASTYGVTAPVQGSETNLNGSTLKQSVVSISFFQGTSAYHPTWIYITNDFQYGIRNYEGNSFTVSVEYGYKITKIAATGSDIDASHYTPNLNEYTSEDGVSSVTFNCSKKNSAIKTLTVTYIRDTSVPLSYTRNVINGSLGSICLPNASTSWSGVDKVYKVIDISNESVTLTSVEEMKAGVPYIFRSNASTITFNYTGEPVDEPVETTYLVGNFDAMSDGEYVPKGSYILQENQFKYVAEEETIKSGANRCYLTNVPISARATLGILLDGDTPTAIDALDAINNNEVRIYDITGKRRDCMKSGINIVGGQCVIRK